MRATFVNRFISVVAVILLAAFLLLQSRAVDQFKSSAMRFVAAEAISFVVVPNLRDFFDKGTPPILEITKALESADATTNFVSLLLPSPKLAEETLPAQCRTVGTSEDLARNGVVPESSFSIARLDNGFKLALKLKEDGSGVNFIADVLFPAYLRIGYPAGADAGENTPAGGATAGEASKAPNKVNSYKYSFDVKGKGVEYCRVPEWKTDDNSALPSVAEGPSDHIFVPLRFVPSLLQGTEASPKLEIACEVSRNSEPAKPCDSEFVEIGIGVETSLERHSGQLDEALRRRNDDISKWITGLREGDTVSIGNQYVAKIDDFHVVEGFVSGARKPPAFRVSRPTISIINDDSLISQFERIVQEGKRHSTTIFAGARPDWIVDASKSISGLPMYLLTPIGIYLSGDAIQINSLSNLVPQDMAIVQTLAATGKSAGDPRGWGDWRKGLGGKISDSSLKLYAEFIRSYFRNVDLTLAEVSPLGQVAIDIMEQGTGAVVVSVNEFYSRGKGGAARLAIAIPDVDAENAGWLVTQSRRKSILRQARYVAEKTASVALLRAAPNELMSETQGLYCHPPFWKLNSLEAKYPPTPGGPPVKRSKTDEEPVKPDPPPSIRSTAEINEEAFNQASWSVIGSGVQFQRILPFSDANVTLWGNAYDTGKGLADDAAAELKPMAEEFTEYMEEMLSNLKDEPERFREVLNTMVPILSQKADVLESKRSRAREKDMKSLVDQLADATNAADAVAKVTALHAAFPSADDIANLGPAEVAKLCQTAEQQPPRSPIAFHDRRVNTLFVVDTPEIIKKLAPPATVRDADGKVLVGFEMPSLAELLKGNGIDADMAQRMVEFPFSNVELSLAGRPSGTGISARINVRKAANK